MRNLAWCAAVTGYEHDGRHKRNHPAPLQLSKVEPKPTPARRQLPARRPCLTETITVQRGDGTFANYDMTVGFEIPTVTPREIFIDGPKDGTDMAAIVSDASVLISLSLQSGVTAEAMSHSIARIPDPMDGPATEPASVIGAAIDALVKHEQEAG